MVFTAVDFFFSPQFGYRLHQRGYVLTRARLFAGWSDLQQDYTEAAEEIPNKHWWRIRLDYRKDPINVRCESG